MDGIMARREPTPQERIDALEALCGEAHQMLGMLGAPVPVLDKFAAAANGDRIPADELLPLKELDFDEVRTRQETIDQISTLLARNLAARGGRQTSEAKRRAAQENGRKGGRPRKNPTSKSRRSVD
jgi:hypothetical protein